MMGRRTRPIALLILSALLLFSSISVSYSETKEEQDRLHKFQALLSRFKRDSSVVKVIDHTVVPDDIDDQFASITPDGATDYDVTRAPETNHGFHQAPPWKDTLDKFQLLVTSIGFFTNILTVVTLQKHGEDFSLMIRLLIQHQALVDSWVCGMAIILIVQPYMAMTGYSALDLFLCQAWHGQAMYWGAVLLSIYNLVFITVERFLAIRFPFSHEHITKKRFFLIITIMYITNISFLLPADMQTRYTADGTCVSEYYFDGPIMETVMYVYGIIWFFACYAIPCAIFIILYGIILYTLYKRRRNDKLGTSSIVDKANAQLTRTAIVVSLVFIMSLGWDSWSYLLGYAGLVSYEFNSPTQIVGVFLSVINSVVNPLIYVLTMKDFRSSLLRLFHCKANPPPVSRTPSVWTVPA